MEKNLNAFRSWWPVSVPSKAKELKLGFLAKMPPKTLSAALDGIVAR
jgi:hypothetical protein